MCIVRGDYFFSGRRPRAQRAEIFCYVVVRDRSERIFLYFCSSASVASGFFGSFVLFYRKILENLLSGRKLCHFLLSRAQRAEIFMVFAFFEFASGIFLHLILCYRSTYFRKSLPRCPLDRAPTLSCLRFLCGCFLLPRV